MPRPPRTDAPLPAPRFVQRISALAFLILLGVWGSAVIALRSAENAALAQAQLEARNVATAFAQEVSHGLNLVADSMNILARRIREANGNFDLSRWMQDIPVLGPSAQARLIAPDGHLMAASGSAVAGPPNRAANEFSDRALVRVHLDRRDLDLFIAPPASDGGPIEVARRVEGADGRLIGALIIQLSPEALTGFDRIIDLAPHRAVTLAAPGNLVLARFGSDGGDELLGDVTSASPAANTVDKTGDGTFRHGQHLFAYRRLTALPLAVTVGLDLDRALAAAREGSVTILVIAATASLLLLCGACHLSREAYRRAAKDAELAREHAKLESEVARRRDAEQRARASHALLQDAIDNISEGFAIYDADDRLVMTNGTMRRLFAEHDELMQPGRPFEDIVRRIAYSGAALDAIGREEAWIAERLQAHREPSGSFEQRLADGRHILVTNRRMHNGGIASLRVDITALKQAEAERAKAQEMLQDAVDSMAEAFVIFDADDRLVLCNEAYRQLHAASAGAIAPGTTFETILRAGLASGQYPDAAGREEEWLSERLNQHRNPVEAVEQVLPGGRHLLIAERRMRNGGIAGLRVDITRVKRAEMQLREAMERLDHMQRIAGLGGVEIRDATGQVTWTTGACDIFGVTPEEVQPTVDYLLGFVHPGDRGTVESAIAETLRTGQAAPPIEYRIIRPDGTERIVYRENAVETDAAGRLVKRIITFKDITELKRVEARLRASQQHLQRAQRVAATGSFELDVATGAIEWTEETYRIFGMTPGTAIDRSTLLSIIVPEDRESFSAQLDAVMQGRDEHVVLEYRILRSDGSVRTLHRELELLRDGDGRPRRILGVIRDITELKQTERRLREMMDNLDRAQRLAHMGSYTRGIDGEGQWSSEVYRIFGVDPATFEPEMDAFLSLVLPEDRPLVETAHAQMAVGVCPEPFEYRIRRPSGEIRHLHRITELIRDKEGRVTGAGGTLWDVTELRAAEIRQKELEYQLQHSQRLEALGTLAGGIAHDLNNTLVPILALAKLALGDLEENSPLRQDLETIVAASERARDLVKQILAFSRKQEITMANTDLATVVRQSLQMLRASVPANISLVGEIGNLPPVLADPGQMQQVLVNLVTNAAQAIGSAWGSIVVSASMASAETAAKPDRDYIRIRVSDDGPGMTKEVMQRIFEPFFTTKAVGEGTGLGLSVVHGIIAGHGGTIEVDSEPGRGTVFTILLPIAETRARKIDLAA